MQGGGKGGGHWHGPDAATAVRAGGAPVAGLDGNWACPSCSNVNFAIRGACNRCQTPRPQEVLHRGKGGAGGGKGGGAPMVGIDGNWACPACNNVNFAVRGACNRCQTPKPPEVLASRTPSGAPIPGVDGNWACPECGNVNFGIREACNRCQVPRSQALVAVSPRAAGAGAWARATPNTEFDAEFDELVQGLPPSAFAPPSASPRGGAPVAGHDGNWACPACQNVNFAYRDACNRCQGGKPQVRAGGAPQRVAALMPREIPMRIPMEMRQLSPAPPASGRVVTSFCFEASWASGVGAGGRTNTGAPIAGLEGNWACPSCQNVNFPQRDACNRCQTPKPDGEFDELEQQFAAEVAQLAAPRGGGARGGGGAPVAGVEGNWACPSCSNVNFAVRTACNRCQTPRAHAAPAGHGGRGAVVMVDASGRTQTGKPIAGVSGNWECTNCKNVNFPVRETCNRCQAPKAESDFAGWGAGAGAGAAAGGKGKAPVPGIDGNWQCAGCGNVNFPHRDACNRCQAPRTEGQEGQEAEAFVPAEEEDEAWIRELAMPPAKKAKVFE